MSAWMAGILWSWAGWNAVGLAQRGLRRARFERRAAHQLSAEFQRRLAELRVQLAARPKAIGRWEGFRTLRVKWHVRESRDCYSLYLVPVDGAALPDFLPGQHLTVRVPVAGQANGVVRCYSLSDIPGRGYYRITVKDLGERGRASCCMAHEVREGDTLEVTAPRGSFHIDPSSRNPIGLIGAGVGITPLFCMLSHVARHQPDRPLHWFYVTRDGDHHPFRADIQRMLAAHRSAATWTGYTRPLPRDVPGRDYTEAGRLSPQTLESVMHVPGMDYFVCGPGEFMQMVEETLVAGGAERERIHAEAFGPSSLMQKHSPASHDALFAVDPVAVRFARSGIDARWDASATNLLELADQLGISVPSGCRAGGCGTCLVPMTRGEVQYDPAPSVDVPDGWCLACVARPRTDLVLDA